MSSPIPPDPYEALKVPKDADISAIRSAHRKLVLKLHPDRIKDEAEKLRGKDEFQKVQQAYELLSDPERRSRYDDKVTLANLRREAMLRDGPTRSATYPMRPAPSSTYSTRREFRPDGRIYEDRVPFDFADSKDSFSSRDRYEDEPLRASSRKYETFERKASTAKSAEKEKEKAKSSSKWDTGAGGMSINAALGLKKKAGEAKKRVQEKKEQEKRDKEREREKNAAKAKARDQEQRRDRSDKSKQQRRVYVESDSETDSDTATHVTTDTIRPDRSAFVETVRPKTATRPRVRREDTRRSSTGTRKHDEDEDDSYDDKWERAHEDVLSYMQQSDGKPKMSRQGSDYWQGADRSRRSGSDSDKRPTSSKGRRSDMESPKVRPPPMPTHNSAPGNLRHHVEDREPREHQRSTSSTLPTERDYRREMPPTFSRSQTMPSSRSTKKDTAPARGSNLKHAETHDSGYGSSSSPHTPDLSGTSPPRDSMREPARYESSSSKSKKSATRYQIVEPDEDFSRPRASTVILEDEPHRRNTRSPSPQRRPERLRVVTDNRSKSSRVPASRSKDDITSPRPSMSHRDSERTRPRSSRESPTISRHNSGRGTLPFEIPTEEPYLRDPSHGRRDSADDLRERDRDYMPNSRHRDHIQNPGMGSRRGSVY